MPYFIILIPISIGGFFFTPMKFLIPEILIGIFVFLCFKYKTKKHSENKVTNYPQNSIESVIVNNKKTIEDSVAEIRQKRSKKSQLYYPPPSSESISKSEELHERRIISIIKLKTRIEPSLEYLNSIGISVEDYGIRLSVKTYVGTYISISPDHEIDEEYYYEECYKDINGYKTTIKSKNNISIDKIIEIIGELAVDIEDKNKNIEHVQTKPL